MARTGLRTGKALLMTTREVSELTGIPPRTFARYVATGLAPKPVRIGHGPNPAVRFRRQDIEEWIEARCPKQEKRYGN